ncbi:MAG: NHL repeat-containing protein [bacterium]
MKKPLIVVLALSVFAAFLVAGCGGGGGAVVNVTPKGGGKMCVPKDAAKVAAAVGETTMGLQGSATIGDLAGDILVTLTPSLYATGSMEFSAIVDGLDTGADCGTIRLNVTGSVCGTTGEIDASIYPPATDSCGGTYSGSLAGTTTTTGAEGTVSVIYTPLGGASQTLSGTWSAEHLNCVRIALSGSVTPNTVTVGVSTQTDFDLIVYDLSCNELTPLTSSISSPTCGAATEAICWSAESLLGSIDSSGILTSISTVSSVSGSLSLAYGPMTDAITVTVSPGASQVADAHTEAAKDLLFQPTVTEADFESAKTEINAALAADADHPGANFLKAIVDIGTELERLSTEVEYGATDADTNFPYNVSYRMATKIFSDAIEPISQFVASPYPKQAVRFTSEDPTIDEYQAEVEANMLDVIDGVVTALEYVKSHVDSNPTWTFAYPKDVEYPSLGDNYIDAKDVKALLGGMYLSKGLVYWGLAYQCDGVTTADWDTVGVDSDGSGKIEPDEQFPTAACGTLRANGSSYLSQAQTFVASGLSLLDAALTAVLAEATPSFGGEVMDSTDITDINHYKHYLTELAASFGGTATSITIPETVECYYTVGSNVYEDSITDPTYSGNADDMAKCEVTVTSQPAITATVKLSGLFSPVISDWRDLTPNVVSYGDGSDTYELIESSGGEMVLPDSTINGIFPNHVQTSWFGYTDAAYHMYIDIVDSIGDPIDCSSLYSGVTLTIDSKVLTAKECQYSWQSGSYNQLAFYSIEPQSPTLPSESDVVTINDMIGTQSTLAGITGCDSRTVVLDDTAFNATVALSGTNCPTVAAGTVTTLAGSGTAGFADGTGTAAQFNGPYGVAVDSSGNVYVVDNNNNRIRKITSAGVVTTFAGSGTAGFADGTGAAAQFDDSAGVAVDSSGNVYVGDELNHRIRKITSAGVVTTLAGSGYAGYADGTGAAAQFYNPAGVAVDSSGNVYVGDWNNHRIRKITSAGVVTTLAGSGTAGFADGTGTAAQFNYPVGVAIDSSGNVYVADSNNNRIRKITSAGVVTTLAGSGTGGYADGTGAAAQFYNPYGVAVCSAGYIYVADSDNNRIRKITSAGVVTTLAGSGVGGYADGTGTAAQFYSPFGVAVDSSGNVYVGDWSNHRIRKITQ